MQSGGLVRRGSVMRANSWTDATEYVAKRYLDPETEGSVYYSDIKMQMVSKHYADLYNLRKPSMVKMPILGDPQLATRVSSEHSSCFPAALYPQEEPSRQEARSEQQGCANRPAQSCQFTAFGHQASRPRRSTSSRRSSSW